MRDRGRRNIAVLAALALVTAACGSDSGQANEPPAAVAAVADEPTNTPDAVNSDASATTEPDPADTEDPEADAEDTSDASSESTQVILEPADWDGLTEWNLPVMGGLTFGVPDGHDVIQDGDMVQIREESDFEVGSRTPTMVVARVYQSASGVPVTSADMTASAITDMGTAESTNMTLSLWDVELQGWRFTVAEDAIDERYIFSSYPAGAVGPSTWEPFPLGEVFLADVPGGVLAIGWSGEDPEQLAAARAIFDRVAPTLELALPFAETSDPVTAIAAENPGTPPTPVALPNGWPAELTAISVPLEAGDYSHLGFGTAFSFSVDDGWWVQPNFPGWMVLTGPASSGPGDRGIVFRSGATGLAPALRTGPAGEALPLDLQAFADDPPETIEILESGEVEVGGASGLRVRFAFDETADCVGGAVCEYFVATDTPYPPASMRKGYQYDLMYLDGGLVDPVTILVETYDSRWFDRAQELLDTVQFDIAS